MSRHFRWQRGFALGGALAILMLNSGIANGDSDVGYSGTVGKHHLRDTQVKPGVKCRYQEGGGSGEEVLYQLVIKPPYVKAVDDTPARDAQKVGWRALIQRRNHGSATWNTIAHSATMTDTAHDDTPAPFTGITMPVTSQFGASFRVHITMYWYASNGTTVTGQATHEVDWYRKIAYSTSGTHNETLHNFCGDYYVE